VAWQLDEAMKKRKISKHKMATLLKTSRTQVDRLLDPRNDITLSSLQRAAAMVGRRVIIELVRHPYPNPLPIRDTLLEHFPVLPNLHVPLGADQHQSAVILK